MNKCPGCGTSVRNAKLDDVAIGQWRGVSYSCPSCSTILSVAIDPVALKADTVSGVAAKLASIESRLANLEDMVARIAQHLAKK
jgi:hypothetical protein